MSLDDQLKNLENDLSSLHVIFEKCVADGDVAGFTRAKAKIKKLEALRQKLLTENSDTSMASATTGTNGIDLTAALQVSPALDKVDTFPILSSLPVEKSNGNHVDAIHHSHEAISQTKTISLSGREKGVEPRHIEGALLDEFDHDKPKPAQSLAMLLLQSLERSAVSQDGAEYSKFEDQRKEDFTAVDQNSVKKEEAVLPDPESTSTAEGLVGELIRLADDANEEKISEGPQSNSSEASLDNFGSSKETLDLPVLQMEQVETAPEIVSVTEIETVELPQQSISSHTPEPEIVGESVDKRRQIKAEQLKASEAPANSAKKEIAKFWKFITKPEEFMEDQNAQDKPGATHD